MAFALRCPDCRKSFKWEPSKPEPRFCPLCAADLGEPSDDAVVCLPAFLSAKSKANDAVYRDIEAKSEQRMYQAAEMAGVPASDMTDLKITNLRPTTEPGAIAAPNVAHNLAALGMRSLDDGFKGSNGAEYSGAVQSGPYANAGAKMRSLVQSRSGLPERPALETQQPGYRIRG